MTNWHDLADMGFSQYSVSDDGDVRNDVLMRELRLSYATNMTSLKVGLVHDETGVQTSVSVPRLVATYFVPGRTSAHDTPLNLNGDVLDNRKENLAWRPRWLCLMFRHQIKQKMWYEGGEVFELNTRTTHESIGHAAQHFGVLPRDINRSIHTQDDVYPGLFRFVRV